MDNMVLAIVITVVAVAAYLGYVLGRKDAEEEQRQAEIEARQRRIDNARRFAVIVQQTQTIQNEERGNAG